MKHSANYIQAPFQVEATDCEHIIIKLVNAHNAELFIFFEFEERLSDSFVCGDTLTILHLQCGASCLF
jgi:hypothetical protein